jgi:hypothetical protein
MTQSGVADRGAFLRPMLAPWVFAICAAGLAFAPAVLNHDGLAMRAVRVVSSHALGIYILQALVVYAPGRVLYGLLQEPLPWSAIAFLLLVALTLVLSTAVTALIMRTPLAWTVGASARLLLPRSTSRAAAHHRPHTFTSCDCWRGRRLILRSPWPGSGDIGNSWPARGCRPLRAAPRTSPSPKRPATRPDAHPG